jgi:hypothetical protein
VKKLSILAATSLNISTPIGIKVALGTLDTSVGSPACLAFYKIASHSLCGLKSLLNSQSVSRSHGSGIGWAIHLAKTAVFSVSDLAALYFG